MSAELPASDKSIFVDEAVEVWHPKRCDACRIGFTNGIPNYAFTVPCTDGRVRCEVCVKDMGPTK